MQSRLQWGQAYLHHWDIMVTDKTKSMGVLVNHSQQQHIPVWATALLLVGIASLYISPVEFNKQDIWLPNFEVTTLHNMVVLICALPYILYAGLRQWASPIFIFWVILLMLTFTLSSPPPHLSAFHSVLAFFSLLLAPLLYQVRFHPTLKTYILRGLAIYPLVSLICAPLLSLVSDVEFGYLEYGFIPRWHGTGNGMYTAVVCLLAMISSIILARQHRGYWKWVLFAYIMLLATGTRSAIMCFPLVFIPEAIRQYWQYRQTQNRAQAKRAILFGAVIVTIFVAYSPLVFIRSTYCQECNPVLLLMTAQNNLFLVDKSGFNSSGRFETWGQFIERGMVNPLFGLGLGAGGSDLLSNRYYHTPHNELIRLFVDGGLIGLIGGVLAYGLTFWGAYRLAKPSYKGYVLVLMVIYMMTAFFSNPLSVQEMAVPFWVMLGVVVGLDDAA